MTERSNAFVYILEEVPHQVGESGPWIKIGTSKNPPAWRLDANLKRGNPRDVVLRAAFNFPSVAQARQMEREAHEHFKSYAYTKEWFKVDWKEVASWLGERGDSVPQELLDSPKWEGHVS